MKLLHNALHKSDLAKSKLDLAKYKLDSMKSNLDLIVGSKLHQGFMLDC